MFRTSCDAQVAHHAAWKRYAIAKNTVLSFRCEHQEGQRKPLIVASEYKAPDSIGRLPRARSGLEEEERPDVTSAASHVPTAHKHRTKSPCFEPSASNFE